MSNCERNTPVCRGFGGCTKTISSYLGPLLTKALLCMRIIFSSLELPPSPPFSQVSHAIGWTSPPLGREIIFVQPLSSLNPLQTMTESLVAAGCIRAGHDVFKLRGRVHRSRTFTFAKKWVTERIVAARRWIALLSFLYNSLISLLYKT